MTQPPSGRGRRHQGLPRRLPFYPGKRYLDRELENPAGKTVEVVGPIVDDIERHVRSELAELTES